MLRGETRLISIPLIGQIGELLKFAANVYFDFIDVFTAVLSCNFRRRYFLQERDVARFAKLDSKPQELYQLSSCHYCRPPQNQLSERRELPPSPEASSHAIREKLDACGGHFSHVPNVSLSARDAANGHVEQKSARAVKRSHEKRLAVQSTQATRPPPKGARASSPAPLRKLETPIASANS